MPLKLQALHKVDELTPEARATGCVNTTFFCSSATSSSTLRHVGTNTDAAAVSNVLLSAFLAFPTPPPISAPKQFAPGRAAAFVVGGGGATRAAIYALSRLNLSPIFIVNRKPVETEAVVDSFPAVDLRPLPTVEQARQEMEDLRKRGLRLVCGVGAIPYMVYKPRMTTLRALGEERGWTSVCGTEVVLGNCFEQFKLWTGRDVPVDVRSSARALLAA
ncbi:3-dehydroquinate synthase [Rhodotorula toruloides]|uniref:3-dehydroquinate synthase n=1 Tax=Rhodotorula toruloides TaxID=5286 RepID=A0A511K768_RHOTO|nr:3-dehydroquinate synthase [Rhodotorula toruloides]